MNSVTVGGGRSARRNSVSGPNFDKVARIYRWAEYIALGPLLRKTREQFLPHILQATQALVLGDGDGRFASALLRRSSSVNVHAIDGSSAMLDLLLTRCQSDRTDDRLSLQRAEISRASLPSSFDLIVTHFFLDCLTQWELEHLCARIAQLSDPGTLWLLSDFGLPPRGLTRLLARAYIRLLYLGFRVFTGLRPQHLPSPQQALERSGFRLLSRKQRLSGFLYSELWQFGPAAECEKGVRATASLQGSST